MLFLPPFLPTQEVVTLHSWPHHYPLLGHCTPLSPHYNELQGIKNNSKLLNPTRMLYISNSDGLRVVAWVGWRYREDVAIGMMQ